MSRYYAGRVPKRVLMTLNDGCPRFLRSIATQRSLVAVSYSHLWVNAFPGIEWSRSLTEMLRFALGRLHPSRDHLAQREYIAKSESWAKHSQWSQLSQSRRVLRWLSARQARPATMSAVAAALVHTK
jgi:hypothetical protein